MARMAAPAFDTLKFANTLKAAGVAPEQVEAQARALSAVLEDARGELATRADVQTIRADMQALKAELKSDLVQLEQRMTIKLGSMMVVAIAVVAGLTKLL